MAAFDNQLNITPSYFITKCPILASLQVPDPLFHRLQSRAIHSMPYLPEKGKVTCSAGCVSANARLRQIYVSLDDALIRSMYEPHTKTLVTIKGFNCSNAIEIHGRIYRVPFLSRMLSSTHAAEDTPSD